MEGTDFVLRKEGSTLQVYLGFELSMDNSAELRKMLGGYRGQDISKIVFDATDLVFISSSGIRAIIYAGQEIGHQPKIEFVNCAEEIYDSFKITGLSNFFSFVEDERKAGNADHKDGVDKEWDKEFKEVRQKQLDNYAAHNDVVCYQMKLGGDED